ncbi:recombinase [Pedobacter paludis]|uniref:Recombinase n=2 Tax=Pedobacter paludis TaxID=2203212 RepID=A0A317F780_9SPHI|nr:recombinase [Pedobacter paludis]
MKTNLSVLYFLKKPKKFEPGIACFIYLRITVDGKRAEMATNRTCNLERWNSKAGKVTGSRQDDKILNSYLEKVKAEVNALYTKLTLEEKEITAESLKNLFLGKEGKQYTILDALDIHNSRMRALVAKGEYAIGTMKRFEVLRRHLIAYLESSYGESDFKVKKIDYQFLEGFDFYLRTVKDNGNNTASKHLKNFGKIIRLCLNWKWIQHDPFRGYKLKTAPVHRDYLTPDELDRMVTLKITQEYLSKVLDFFLFSCFTGLSYIDVKHLKLTDIALGVDGEKWIFIHREKTDIRVAVPLLPIAEQILSKYADHPACVNEGRALPLTSNQKINEYLVDVAKLAGINKILGNRIAKRTFGTTVTLMNDVPIESVSKMLGHTNIRTTQLYAKILDDKVGRDMAGLRKKYTALTHTE